MGRLDKVKDKFLNPSSIVTIQELRYLLGQLGYTEKKTGKTSGSRVAFIHTGIKHIIRLHLPHPGNELKRYLKQFIVRELKKQGML